MCLLRYRQDRHVRRGHLAAPRHGSEAMSGPGPRSNQVTPLDVYVLVIPILFSNPS